MEKKSNKTRELDFGLLGNVEITELEYDAPDVYAKAFSSGIPCDGSRRGDGPTYDDDQGCATPMMT